MLCKYYLQIGSDAVTIGSEGCIDVSRMLSNVDDIKLSYTRSDLAGVIRKFGGEFRFVGRAFELLVEHFVANGLASRAAVAACPIDNTWNFNKTWESPLDFSTFQYTAHDCRVNAVDYSLATVIKANKSVSYEYAVADIRETARLNYDHMLMNSFANYVFGGEMAEGGGYSTITFQRTGEDLSWPLYITKSEVADKRMLGFFDSNQVSGSLFLNDGAVFFENYSDNFMTVRMTIKVSGTCNAPAGSQMRIVQSDDAWISFTMYTLALNTVFGDERTVDLIIFPKQKVIMKTTGWTKSDVPVLVNVNSDSFIRFDVSTRSNADEFDVVTPLKVMESLVASMTGRTGESAVTCSIEADSRCSGTVILPAESIRKIEGAKLHTSWNEFCAFMSAQFGMVPLVGKDSVGFVHRRTLFDDFVCKRYEDDLSELDVSVDSSMIYSRVRVGYDRQDYESVNGRYEWRFGIEYATGVSLTDNVLDVICPYRADAYGIEFLSQMISEDTTDSGSDEDVFIVNAVYDSETVKYELVRDIEVSGVFDAATMFNAAYSQRYMIAANEDYIGSFTRNMAFASMEGNAAAVVGTQPVNAGVTLTDALFMPCRLSVEVDDIEVPSDLYGIVRVDYGGRRHVGYIDDITLCFGRVKPARYELILNAINNL